MAYTKYSLTPANNTATPPDGAPEGMLPSAVNDTMRDMMAQIRDCGDGIRDGTYTMTAAKITGGTITGVTFTGNTFSNPTITGVSTFAAGTVSAPAITTSGDTNTGIFFPAADTIAFSEGGAEAMRIDSSGNVGIGVTPKTWSNGKALEISNAGNALWSIGSSDIRLVSNTYYNSDYKYAANGTASMFRMPDDGTFIFSNAASGTANNTITFTERMRITSGGDVLIGTTTQLSSEKLAVKRSTAGEAIRWSDGATGGFLGTIANVGVQLISGANLLFGSADAERMRIDNSGNVLVGASTTGLENGGIQFQPNGNTASVPFIGCGANSSSNTYITLGVYSTSASQYQFYVGYGGTVYARSTSITGLSDISEKENIQPLETGLNEVLALQPRRFDWKNGSGQNIAGFVAQEVETVLPDLVEEYKVDEQTTKKGLKMGDMIPTLVKAIQEQQAMIEELKAKVTALENK